MRQIQKNPLSLWAGEIPSNICDKIVEEGLNLNLTNATVRKEEIDKNLRNNKIGWFPKSGWVDELLLRYVSIANFKNNWNFNITESESPQFTIYNTDEFYGWHRDSDVNRLLERKISVTVQLSSPSEYGGGDFRIKELWKDKEIPLDTIGKIKGTIIIFPSCLTHCAMPVTQGTRYSLVQWYSGPQYT